MDPAARTLNRLSYRADRAIDRLTAPLADAVADSVRRHAVPMPDGTAVVTPLARLLILRETEAALAAVYGRFRGDATAPMYQTIAQAANAAYGASCAATAASMRATLKDAPDVVAALEGRR